MTLTLRYQHLPTHARPNAAESVTLSKGYEFAAAVRLIDTAVMAGRRFAIRRHDGTLTIVDTSQMQTIALREVL